MQHCTVIAHAYRDCLPYTGTDLILPFAVGGLALFLLGVAMFKFFSRPKRSGWPPVRNEWH